jgi:hypothetical protein
MMSFPEGSTLHSLKQFNDALSSSCAVTASSELQVVAYLKAVT